MEERFDRDYAAWKEQYPSKTFGQWLAQWGRGNGEQEIETEGGEGEGEGEEELQPQKVADSGCYAFGSLETRDQASGGSLLYVCTLSRWISSP